MPPFEGWDEYQHVAYVVHVSETGRRATLGETEVPRPPCCRRCCRLAAAPVRPGADGPPPRRGGICGVLVPSPIEGDSRRECPGPPQGDRTHQSHQALPGAAFVVVLPPGSPVVRVDGRRARPAELGRGTEANKPAVHGGRGMGRTGGGRRSGAIVAGCGVGRPGDRGAPRVLDDRHARLQRCPGHLPGHGRRGRRWGWRPRRWTWQCTDLGSGDGFGDPDQGDAVEPGPLPGGLLAHRRDSRPGSGRSCAGLRAGDGTGPGTHGRAGGRVQPRGLRRPDADARGRAQPAPGAEPGRPVSHRRDLLVDQGGETALAEPDVRRGRLELRRVGVDRAARPTSTPPWPGCWAGGGGWSDARIGDLAVAWAGGSGFAGASSTGRLLRSTRSGHRSRVCCSASA